MYRKLASVILVASAIQAKYAVGLGLGELTMHSALNQQLDAEIALSNVGDLDSTQIIARLADQKAFDNANIDRTYFLTNINFEVVINEDGTGAIRLSSKRRLNEPYLDFLVEAKWPSGRMLRSYTALVDLPVYSKAQGDVVNLGSASSDELSVLGEEDDEAALEQESVESEVVLPVDVRESSDSEEETIFEEEEAVVESDPVQDEASVADDTESPISSLSEPEPEPEPAYYSGAPDVENYGDLPDEYTIQKNDTLWDIASRLKPSSDVSVQQTMLAIQRTNEHAFIDGNINRIRAGAVLSVPSESVVQELAAQDAISEVKQQNTDWKRGQLDASENFGDRPKLPTNNDAADGHLSLTSAGSGLANGSDESQDGGSAALRNQLNAVKDQLANSNRENASLSSRVTALKDQVDQLKRMIELKDAELATLQQQMSEAGEEPSAESVELQKTLAEAEAALEQAETAVAEQEAIAEQESQETGAPTVPGGEELAEEPVVEEPQETQVEEQAAVTPAPAPAGPSLLDTLLEKPIYIGAFALLIVLCVVGFLLRRKGQQESAALEDNNNFEFDELDADSGVEYDESFASSETGEYDQIEEPGLDADMEAPALDLDEVPEIDGDGALDLETSDEVQPTTMQTGDAIGEADIYIAYGRFEQAVELLESAIANSPDDVELRTKLLEVCLESRNKEGFQQQYMELQSRGQVQAVGHAKELLTSVDGVADWLDDIPATASVAADASMGASMDDSLDAFDAIDEGGEELADLDSDFDLDDVSADVLDETVVETAVNLDAVPEMDMSQAAAEDDFDLDLSDIAEDEGLDSLDDFSLDTPEPTEPEALEEDFNLDDAFNLDEPAVDDASDAGDELGSLEDDFDLDLSDLDDSALASDEVAAEPEQEEEVLEFDGLDLGGLDGSGEESGSAEEDLGADLDLSLGDDLDDLGDLDLDSALDEPQADAQEASLDDDLGGDLDLDLDLGTSLDADVDLSLDEDLASAAEEAPSLDADDLDLGSLDDLDGGLDLDVAEDSSAEESLDLGDLDLGADPATDEDVTVIDVPEESEEVAVAPEAEEDLGVDLDLDLGASDLAAEPELEPAVESVSSAAVDASEEAETAVDIDIAIAVPEPGESSPLAALEGEDLEFLTDVDEVSTKLDLARAYIDMGDVDGARDILMEVMSEGRDEQKSEASTLLDGLE